MSKITWDNTSERLFETGLDRGVLYPYESNAYANGVAWNGLTAVTESPSGAEKTPLYAGNKKYVELMSVEEFGGTIEAYTYPDEFAACDGSAELAAGITVGQQPRKAFGMTYRTLVGNDTEGENHGYKIHLVYGALASPSEKAYQTINDSPEAVTFSWEFSTTPVEVGEGFKPTAHLEIESAKVDATTLKAIEDLLYGTADKEASLPLPSEILALVNKG